MRLQMSWGFLPRHHLFCHLQIWWRSTQMMHRIICNESSLLLLGFYRQVWREFVLPDSVGWLQNQSPWVEMWPHHALAVRPWAATLSGPPFSYQWTGRKGRTYLTRLLGTSKGWFGQSIKKSLAESRLTVFHCSSYLLIFSICRWLRIWGQELYFLYF